jgi:hypothetical protein
MKRSLLTALINGAGYVAMFASFWLFAGIMLIGRGIDWVRMSEKDYRELYED